MKKNVFGRQFKRDANERKALFKGLMTSLVMHERIQTTEEKAKAIKGSVEKLVTKAKKKGVLATPHLLPFLHVDAVKKMVSEIAPRFAKRAGGYTRIVKLGRRFGDDASVVVMEWVENGVLQRVEQREGKKAGKQTEAVEATASATEEKSKKKTKKSAVVKADNKKPVIKNVKKASAGTVPMKKVVKKRGDK